MKTLTKTFLYFIALIAITSCTQDFLETLPKDNLQTIETGTLNFIYKGISYTSEYSRLSDSTVIFKDNQVSELSKLLATKPNLISYIHPDGSLEYVETLEETNAKISNEIEKSITTRSTIETKGVGPLRTFCEAECHLYRHSNHKGWQIQHIISACPNAPYPRSVKQDKLPSSKDNKISSIKVFARRDPNANVSYEQPSGSLRLFQYENHTGNSLILPFTNVWSEINIPSLKKYPLYPGSKDNWNDTITSYGFTFN